MRLLECFDIHSSSALWQKFQFSKVAGFFDTLKWTKSKVLTYFVRSSAYNSTFIALSSIFLGMWALCQVMVAHLHNTLKNKTGGTFLAQLASLARWRCTSVMVRNRFSFFVSTIYLEIYFHVFFRLTSLFSNS